MPTRRIRTVLYGDQVIEPTELDLLHTPALQRLYDLHQLGLTDRVFIDASHSRLHHVVGVLAQVDRIIAAIAHNLETGKARTLEYRGSDGKTKQIASSELHNYVRRRRRATRLMGLLHDLTHAPYGHTLEDEIELVEEKHDDPGRQADAFYRLLVQYIGWLALEENLIDATDAPRKGRKNREEDVLLRFLEAPALAEILPKPSFIEFIADLAANFLKDTPQSRAMARAPTAPEMVSLFRDLRFAMRALLWLDALHKDNLDQLINGAKEPILPGGEYPFEQVIDRALERAGEPLVDSEDEFHLQRDGFLLDVIGNTICADLLDYAKRDSHFSGLKLDYDSERIVENFTLVSYRRPRDLQNEKKLDYRQKVDPILRTGISIFTHKLRLDVPGELMNLLQVRFYVYQRVLFHPTKCVAGAMLGSALKLIGWKELPIHFRFVGDNVFLSDLAEIAKTLRALIAQFRSARDKHQIVLDDLVELGEIYSKLPDSSVVLGIRQLLRDRASDDIDEVYRDLGAATRLLDRLFARRYHRPIFRLLPSATVSRLNFHAEQIAPLFRDADVRANAERLIEKLAHLPRGTVTIHCPNAKGPRKIAEILILGLHDEVEVAYPLREISGIDPEIFDKHENAIRALEEMYRSMWRLMVSVAPPHHKDHEAINPVIGRVLYSVLSGESYAELYPDPDKLATYPTVRNDERQTDELNTARLEAESDRPTVQLLYADGRTASRPEWFLQVADDAVPILEERVPEVEGYLAHGRFVAEGREPTTLREVLSRVIRSELGSNPSLDRDDDDDRQPGLFEDGPAEQSSQSGED